LFDTFASRRDALDRARDMIERGNVKHVVLYTFDAAEEFLTIARDIGVSGVVLKSASGDVLATAIERVVAGERVGLDDVVRATRSRTSKDLSPREQEVLALLALGRTNAEIGEQLFLSVDTVKTYVRRVFAKLGVNNRTQAAMHAAERSLTPRNGSWITRESQARHTSSASDRPQLPG
jgi:DNA-binding NarL/FixJ family response regulator